MAKPFPGCEPLDADSESEALGSDVDWVSGFRINSYDEPERKRSKYEWPPNVITALERIRPREGNYAELLRTRRIVDRMQEDQRCVWFIEKVSLHTFNGDAASLKRYNSMIRQPICLNDITEKVYNTADDMVADVNLVFANAMRFNRKGEQCHEDAVYLKNWFEQQRTLDSTSSDESKKKTKTPVKLSFKRKNRSPETQSATCQGSAKKAAHRSKAVESDPPVPAAPEALTAPKESLHDKHKRCQTIAVQIVDQTACDESAATRYGRIRRCTNTLFQLNQRVDPEVFLDAPLRNSNVDKMIKRMQNCHLNSRILK